MHKYICFQEEKEAEPPKPKVNTCKYQGRRGQWTLKYTGTQSLKAPFHICGSQTIHFKFVCSN